MLIVMLMEMGQNSRNSKTRRNVWKKTGQACTESQIMHLERKKLFIDSVGRNVDWYITFS